MNIKIEPIVYKICAASILLGVFAGGISGLMFGFVYGQVVCGIVTLATFYYTIFSVGENKCFKETKSINS
jgi:polyferredoxin